MTAMTQTRSESRIRQLPVIVRRNSPAHIGLLAVAAGLVALAVLWGSIFEPFHQGQITRVMIYAVAIAGLNVCTGYTGMISVGHSAFFGLGAYTTGILVVTYGWQPAYTLPVAFAVCFVTGLVVGLPALRIRGLYFAMVTLAFGVSFPEVIGRFESLTGGSSGLTIRRTMLRPPEWTGFALNEKAQWLYWLSAAMLIVVLLIVRNVVRSRYGLALIAVRDNEIAAAASGVNLAVVKTVAFGLSGALTGIGGSLFAMFLASLVANDSFTLLSAIILLTGLMIGGQSTQFGPVIGALVVVYLPYYTSDLGQGQVSAVLFGGALIAIIFIVPLGLVGGFMRLVARFLRVLPPEPPARDDPGPDPDPAPLSPDPEGVPLQTQTGGVPVPTPSGSTSEAP